MQAALDRFLSFMAIARTRNAKQMRFAGFMAALIAVLLWQTRWLALQPGLGILFIGQLGALFVLLYRNATLSRDFARWKTAAPPAAGLLVWFDREKAFATRLALFENGSRAIGMIVLAYGFWKTTGNVPVALVIGIVYPLSVYFGMVRKKNQSTIKDLRAWKNEIQELIISASIADAG